MERERICPRSGSAISARWRLLIGAVALLVQLLGPVQHALAGFAGGSDGQAVLCTAEGNVVVDLNDLGDPGAPAGKPAAGPVCPICAIGGTQALVMPTPAPAAVSLRDHVRINFIATSEPAFGSGGRAAYGSRAPPVSI